MVGVDNFITGAWRNLEHLEGRDDFFFIEHDISTPLFLAEKVDGVLHFASPGQPRGLSGASHPDPEGRESGDPQLPWAWPRLTAPGFLLASTSEVYGDPQIHPQTEDYWGHVNPIGPRGVYDEAKRFAEAITMAYHRYHGLDTRIARIFNTYGPRMRPADGRVVSNFIVQALRGEPITLYGDGSQTRSFCYVEDEVEGLFRLFFSDYTDPVNIGNPNEFTIRQLAEMIRGGNRERIGVGRASSSTGRSEGPAARHHPGEGPLGVGSANRLAGRA